MTEQNDAAGRMRAWRVFAATNRPGYDHLADVSYDIAPIGDADLDEVLRQLAAARDTAALANLRLTDLLASIRAVAEPLEALAIGAGGEDGDLRWGIALRHARALAALAGTADTTTNVGN